MGLKNQSFWLKLTYLQLKLNDHGPGLTCMGLKLISNMGIKLSYKGLKLTKWDWNLLSWDINWKSAYAF